MKTFDSSRFFYQNSDKGIVRTPEELAQEMISNIPEYIFESSTTTFLDPACGRGTFLIQITKKLKSYGHSWENITSRIFGIDIDPFSGIKQAQYILGSKNIIVQDFLEMSFPENWPKEFDVIVSNPPYSSKLDLKFLDRCFDISTELVIFVHPSSFLLERKGVTKIYSDIRNKIQYSLDSLTLFNGNGIFGIGLFVPCLINVINKKSEKTQFTFRDLQTGQEERIDKSELSSLSIFGYSKDFNSFSSKIREKMNVMESLHKYSNLDKKERKLSKDCFYVEFTMISGRGHRGEHLKMSDPILKDDFFTFISKNQLVVKRGNAGQETKYNIWFEFETEEEGKNFIKYLTSKISRACLSITKVSQHLENGELKTVPWMDFSKEINTDFFYSNFELTAGEINFIENKISSYYENTGRE
jgi:predicted RNA methylase